MGIIKQPLPVKLFIGMLSQDVELFKILKEKLRLHYGEVDLDSPIWPWEHTEYYKDEMGGGLKRKFIFYERLINPIDISDIKVKTNELEQQYINDHGGRKINLDPGYLDASKIVLVTTKNYSHRVYLNQGIYGEVTLIHKDGTFQPLPYTYPDYSSEEYRALFREARRMYKKYIVL